MTYPLDADGIDAVLDLLSNDYPVITRKIQLNFPSQDIGRPIYALRVGVAEDKHGVLFIGGTHARELVNPDLLLTFAAQLCDAYTRGTELRFGPVSHAPVIAKILVEAVTLFIVPMINPDGRIWVQTSDTGWRKNRRTTTGTTCRGVDVNRNFDFLWAEGIATSTNPCDYQVYRGPLPGSDNETKNVKWLLDTFPNIGCMLDVHSYGQYVLYPWGDAPNQPSDATMSFQNHSWDGMRRDPKYREYMPSSDERRYRRRAEAVANAIAAVHGTVYEPTQTYFMDFYGPGSTYPTTATSNDYAYSRHFTGAGSKVYAFAIETGTQFQPSETAATQWIREVSNGLVTFLLRCLCSIDELLAQIFGDDAETRSAALRRLRDERLEGTEVGRQLVDLLEDNGAEILAIIDADEQLRDELSRVLGDVAELVSVFDEGKRVTVDASLTRRINAVARQVSRAASPQLTSAIKQARAILRNFEGSTIPQGLKKAQADL